MQGSNEALRYRRERCRLLSHHFADAIPAIVPEKVKPAFATNQLPCNNVRAMPALQRRHLLYKKSVVGEYANAIADIHQVDCQSIAPYKLDVHYPYGV